MNNYDIYIPIDIRGPIKTGSRTNLQLYNNNNPAILFQLFDGPRPLMLDDISSVAIAFTNTNNESVTGSGTLQVVNPHRGTISYQLSKGDITMSGINTVTLLVNTGDSSFTVQTTVYSQDISDSLYDALNSGNSGSDTDDDSGVYYGDDFPCLYFNIYCRLCRRCKWVWFHNTYPKPLNFNEIKLCKNPYVTPPIKNFANLPEYEQASYPTTLNESGDLIVCIDEVHYVCDVGTDGSIYLKDKSLEVPDKLVGLYLGSKGITYYKTSEKVTTDDFDINSLFDDSGR